MTATAKRPVFLNLVKIRLPVAGVMSIVHRATGVVMTLAAPFLIYLLDMSLEGPAGFASARGMLSGVSGTLVVFLLIWAVLHHLFAGVRYLLIDLDIGVEKPVFRQTAWAVLIAAPVVAAITLGALA